MRKKEKHALNPGDYSASLIALLKYSAFLDDQTSFHFYRYLNQPQRSAGDKEVKWYRRWRWQHSKAVSKYFNQQFNVQFELEEKELTERWGIHEKNKQDLKAIRKALRKPQPLEALRSLHLE